MKKLTQTLLPSHQRVEDNRLSRKHITPEFDNFHLTFHSKPGIATNLLEAPQDGLPERQLMRTVDKQSEELSQEDD